MVLIRPLSTRLIKKKIAFHSFSFWGVPPRVKWNKGWKQGERTLKFGLIKRVDKGRITTVKYLESWRFEY